VGIARGTEWRQRKRLRRIVLDDCRMSCRIVSRSPGLRWRALVGWHGDVMEGKGLTGSECESCRDREKR